MNFDGTILKDILNIFFLIVKNDRGKLNGQCDWIQHSHRVDMFMELDKNIYLKNRSNNHTRNIL